MLSFAATQRTGFRLESDASFDADLTIEEVHERQNEATEFTTERGESFSDHIIKRPATLRLEGFVSDAHLTPGGGPSRDLVSAFDELERLADSREPMTVVTGIRVYDSLALTRLSLPRSTPGTSRFTLEFKAIDTVETRSTQIELRAAPEVKDTAAPERNAGRQSTKQATAAEDERMSSLLFDWGIND